MDVQITDSATPTLFERCTRSVSNIYRNFLDKITPLVLWRWMFTIFLLILYTIRILYIQAFHVVTYTLGIFLLSVFIGFLSPKIDPAFARYTDEEPTLPTIKNEEFRPFLRRMPEMSCWHNSTLAIIVSLFFTLIKAFDVPVFWPILVIYFGVLCFITLKRQIKRIEEPIRFVDESLYQDAFVVLQSMRSMGKLCDVTLKVQDQEFTAHKIILAISIPFFKAMFMHEMRESSQDLIPVYGIEAAAFESLINFAYSGEILINSDNVFSLAIGSSFLQMLKVHKECCRFIYNSLNASNALDSLQFAQSYLCESLLVSINDFISKAFEEIVSTDDFLSMNAVHLEEILSRDNLILSSEEVSFESIMRWVEYQPAERSVHLPRLLRQVRFPLLSPKFIADRASKIDMIRSSIECRDLLDEARDFLLLPERRPDLLSFRCVPRCSDFVVGCVYVVGGMSHRDDLPSTVERYDPLLDNWSVLENVTTNRTRVGVAVLDGRLYAMGGYDGVNRLNIVEVFDPSANLWTQVEPMNYRRSALGAASHNHYLYVCGGYNGALSLSTCECYCPRDDRWKVIANMKVCRSAGGVVSLGSTIYAIGGHNGLTICDSMESLDVGALNTKWEYLPPMLNRRSRHAVTALSGKLYVAGGYNGMQFLSSVECFDLTLQQWTCIQPMRIARSRLGLASCFGYLFAIGGYDGLQNLRSLEKYDEKAKKWSFSKPLRIHEGGVGVGVIPNQLMYSKLHNRTSIKTFDELFDEGKSTEP